MLQKWLGCVGKDELRGKSEPRPLAEIPYLDLWFGYWETEVKFRNDYFGLE
jgi:hypothetical protein